MKTVLVVEDDEEASKFLKSVFEKRGYDVVGITHDGKDGFEKYKSLRPDIVTLDILLPEVDGKQCAEMILNYDPDAKIVVVSVLGKADLKFIKELGVKSFVKKPIDVNELFSAVVNLSVTVMKDEKGKEIGVVGMAENIRENEKREQELEHALSLLDLFTDILRHDLLNPAGIIKNYAELLMENSPDDAKQNVLAIRKNAERIIEMIEDAAKFTKLESRGIMEFKLTDMGEIVEEAVDLFSHQAEEKKMHIVNRIEKGKYRAELNPVFRDVVANLISNSIKYSAPGRTIELSAKEENGSILLACKDQGSGVSDEYKAKIFKRFERAERTAIKGIGLGLAIVKRIIDLHEGRVWVEDNPEGGSIFFVRIPKKRT